MSERLRTDESIRATAKETLRHCIENNSTDWGTFKNKLKADISDLLYEKTKRKPMILPVIMEI
jgi:ribonuclease J